MKCPLEWFDSEEMEGWELRELVKTWGVLVMENLHYFRRNQWGRYNTRARRMEDQGLRREWVDGRATKKGWIPWGHSGTVGGC